MKKLSLFLIAFTCLLAAHASHLMGGYISYHTLSARTYEITLTLYSDSRQPSDGNTIGATLFFGDNSSEAVTRTSTMLLNGGMRMSTYTVNHSYSTDGVYTISYTDANLITNIKNINSGSSSNFTLYLEAEVNTAAATIPEPYVSKPLAYAIPSVAVGDSLSYNPVFPLQDSSWKNSGINEISYALNPILNYPGYTVPANMHMNAYSGLLTSSAFVQEGYYLVMYKITFKQFGLVTGSSQVAQLIRCENLPYTLPSPVTVSNAIWNDQEGYQHVIDTNELVVQDFSYASSPIYYHEAFGEPIDSNAADTNLNNGLSTLRITWQNQPAYRRSMPYYITFRVHHRIDTALFKDVTVAWHNGGPINTGIENPAAARVLSAYPNPASNECYFDLQPANGDKLEVYNLNGDLVYSTQAQAKGIRWDSSLQSAGLYIGRLQGSDGKTKASVKILVRH